MKKRMLKIRLFAGGLAAVMSMSTLSSVAFAAEAEPVEQVIEAENPSTDYYAPEIIQENTLVTFENTQEATDEVNTNDVMNEMVTENEAETSATEEANTVAADVQVTEMSVADEAAVDEVAVDEVVDDAIVEDAENSTTTDKEALDILVAKMDVENPVKCTDTFVKESQVDGAIVRIYNRETGEKVQRIYNPDGTFAEKVIKPAIIIHAPRLCGPDGKPYLPEGFADKEIPEQILSVRTFNADGSWTDTIYEEGEEKSKTDYSADEMTQVIQEENKTFAEQKEARRIEESADLDEILQFFSDLDTNGSGVIAENADATDSKEDVKYEKSKAEVPPIIKKAYSVALDKIIGKMPGSSIIGGTVKDLLMKAMNMDDPKRPDPVIERINTAQNKTEQLLSSNKRTDIIVNAISVCGQALDKFSSTSITLANDIYTEKERKTNGKINEDSMLINIAKKIGTPDQWYNGGANIFTRMSDAASVLGSMKDNGTSSDPNNRNLYQLFFDYNKETSMFSGEAMDKSAGQLQKRIQDFALNCNILMEALNIQEKVANFTDEQLNAITNEDDRAFCKKLKANKDEIESKKMQVTFAFTGNKNSKLEKAKYGIIDAFKQYASQSRTVFMEQTNENFKEVRLSDQVYTINSEDVTKKKITSHSALTTDQIYKLQQHVNGMGITMEEYLNQVGFDLWPIKNSYRTKYLSTGRYEIDNNMGRWGTHGKICGTKTKTYYGIKMNEKNAKETGQCSYYRSVSGTPWGTNEEKTYTDGLLVILQMEQ